MDNLFDGFETDGKIDLEFLGDNLETSDLEFLDECDEPKESGGVGSSEEIEDLDLDELDKLLGTFDDSLDTEDLDDKFFDEDELGTEEKGRHSIRSLSEADLESLDIETGLGTDSDIDTDTLDIDDDLDI